MMAFGLWLNTTCHRQSPGMIHWAIILAPVLSCLLCGASATKHSRGRCTVSSVLTHVEEGCHWMLGVIMWLEVHWGSRAHVLWAQWKFHHCALLLVIQLWGSLWKICGKHSMHCVSVRLQYVLLTYSTCVWLCVQDNMPMRYILKSLIVVTGKIPQPSARLTSDSVLIPYSLSNTHKTVAQHSQYTYDDRPVCCPDICVCVCFLKCFGVLKTTTIKRNLIF